MKKKERDHEDAVPSKQHQVNMQKFGLEKVVIFVMVLYPQLGVAFVFTGALSPRFPSVKVFKQKLGALTHTFPNFADLQCFCLDRRFSLSLSTHRMHACVRVKRGTSHIC